MLTKLLQKLFCPLAPPGKESSQTTCSNTGSTCPKYVLKLYFICCHVIQNIVPLPLPHINNNNKRITLNWSYSLLLIAFYYISRNLSRATTKMKGIVWILLGLVLLSQGIPIKTPPGNEEHKQCKLLQSSEGIKADCRKQGLTKVPCDLPAKVTALDISSNNIEILKETSFQGLQSLTTLSINANLVRIIKSGAFSPLLLLKRLHLNSNALSELRNDTFAHNYNLEVLEFAANRFTVFPVDNFRLLPKVTEISFVQNEINKICFKKFTNPHIKELDLTDNKISSLKDECFHPLSKTIIQTIKLINNKLSSLPDYVFKYMKKVQNIVLDTNFITIFSVNPFLGMTMLTTLNFTFNRLNNIIAVDQNTSLKIPPLKKLKLDKNELSVIPPAAFQGLDKLLWLHLGGNRIRILFNDSFYGLDHLQSLILSNNKLDNLNPEIFTNLPMLELLDLSFNAFKVINPNYFHGARSLKVLLFQRNKIETIMVEKEKFWSIPLTTVDLSFNNIITLDRMSFFGMHNVTKLILSGNKFNILRDHVFDGMSNLQNLVISKIQSIENIFTPFDGLQNLLKLNIHGTSFPLQRDTFSGLDLLKQLDLTRSTQTCVTLWKKKSALSPLHGVTTILLNENFLDGLQPGTFVGLGNLTRLEMAECKISSLHRDVFRPLCSLQILDLRQNKLQKLDIHYFQPLHQLRFLYLKRNSMTELDKILLQHNTNLRYLDIAQNTLVSIKEGTIFPQNISLDISDNPISCRCNLAWFRNMLDLNNITLKKELQTICSDSSLHNLIGKPILAFHPADECSPNIVLIITLSISFVALLITGAVAYQKRWWLNYKCFHIKLLVIGYEELYENEHRNYEYDMNIIFHHDDEEWVKEVLGEGIREHLPDMHRIVCGDDDLPLGGYYNDAIDYVTENSYKTIAVITNAAVDDHAFIQKLRLAVMHMNEVELEKTILIFLEDVPDNRLPYLVRLLLSKNKPYFLWRENEYGQRLFWEKFVKEMKCNKKMNDILPI